jgi:hypothetical protein
MSRNIIFVLMYHHHKLLDLIYKYNNEYSWLQCFVHSWVNGKGSCGLDLAQWLAMMLTVKQQYYSNIGFVLSHIWGFRD